MELSISLSAETLSDSVKVWWADVLVEYCGGSLALTGLGEFEGLVGLYLGLFELLKLEFCSLG